MSLVFIADPFRPAPRALMQPRRATLAAIVRRQRCLAGVPLVIAVNGAVVPAENWQRQQVSRDDAVLLLAHPLGGNGGGRKIAATMLTLVAAYFTFGAGAGYGGAAAGLWGSAEAAVGSFGLFALKSAVMFGAGAIGQSIMRGAASPDAAINQPMPGSLASLAAPQNALMGEITPVQYGRVACYPPLWSKPYSEYVDNQQYMYLLLCIGRGYYQWSNNSGRREFEFMGVDDSSLTDIGPDVEWSIIEPGESPALYNPRVVVVDEAAGQAIDSHTSWLGPYTVNDPATQVNQIMLDLLAPRGLGAVQDDGSIAERQVGINLEARTINDVGVATGSWTALAADATRYIEHQRWTTSGTQQTVADGGTYTVIPMASGVATRQLRVEYDWPAYTDGWIKLEARQVDAAGNPVGGWLTRYATGPGGKKGGRYWLRLDLATTARYQARITASLWQGDDRSMSVNLRSIGYMSTPTEIRAATLTPQRATIRYVVPAGRYEVRIKRTAAKNTGTNEMHDANIASIRAQRTGGLSSFGDRTMLEIKLRAGSALATSTLNKIRVITTRKLPLWNGSSWSAPTATTSPAWALADLCRAGYGRGLSDSEYDLSTLQSLAGTLAARGDQFNFRFDSPGEFLEQLNRVGKTCRVFAYESAGVVRFIREAKQTLPVRVFTPENLLARPKRQYLMPGPETPDAIEVTYIDDRVWRPQRLLVMAPGVTVPVRVQKVQLDGVTRPEQAHREAVFALSKLLRQRVSYTLRTEQDGYLVTPLSVIKAVTDDAAWGQSAEVEAISGSWSAAGAVLTLTPPPVWASSGSHQLRLIGDDGIETAAVNVTRGADDSQAMCASALPFAPYVGAARLRTRAVLIGPDGYVGTPRKLRVLGVRPVGEFEVELACINEDDAVHDSDTSGVPAYPAPEALPAVEGVPLLSGLSMRTSGSPLQPNVSVEWLPLPDGVAVLLQYSRDRGATWTDVPGVTARGASFVVPAGQLQVRARATRGVLASSGWQYAADVGTQVGGSLQPVTVTNVSGAASVSSATDAVGGGSTANRW